MSRVTWSLNRGRPAIEIELVVPGSPFVEKRLLLADTGAGRNAAPFEMLLDEEDCLTSASRSAGLVRLAGAYSGEFRSYFVEVRLPRLDYSAVTTVVGIPRPPLGFDGIAAFKFLNRFRYGNFGQPEQFGLEPLAGPTD